MTTEPLKVVYDTNVIVSAALKPGSLPDSLVSLATGRQVRLFVSPEIFAEYREVLSRPKFDLDRKTLATFLRNLRRAAVMVHPRERVTRAPEEPDNRFLECSQAAQADYLVTGNKRHFPFPEYAGTAIVSPAEFAHIVATTIALPRSAPRSRRR